MHTCLKGFGLMALLAGSVFIQGCRQSREKPVDLPDAQGIYTDIKYLDSLMQSNQIDSISDALMNIDNLLSDYARKNQTPDEQAILDSINRIKDFSSDFLRFCIDSRSNIELLNQDVSSAEMQYRSGKIKAAYFISALVESEQTLVDINNRFLTDRARVLTALKRAGILQTLLIQQSSVQPF